MISIGSDNADISNVKKGLNPFRRKPKVFERTLNVFK